MKMNPRQLELPVMVNIKNSKPNINKPEGLQPKHTENVGFHKPASPSDQSIYQTISDNYFKGLKQK